MIKKIFACTTAFTMAFAVLPAFAGNVDDPIVTTAPAPAPVFAPVPTAANGDWGGFYVGGSLGYADISEDSSSNFDDDGTTYGIFTGYNYDFGRYVLGGEVEISGFDVSNNGIDVDSVTRLKVRAGYDAGRFLPYLTAGYASLDAGGDASGSDEGVIYGLGLDYSLTENWTVGGEIMQHEFNDFEGSGLDFDATTISARVAFSF